MATDDSAAQLDKLRAKLRRAEADAVVGDPAGGFPYHADRARAALAAEPEGNNHPASWYISEEIIACSQRYSEAKAAYLHDPADPLAQLEFEESRDQLVAARAEFAAARGEHMVLAGHPDEVLLTLHLRHGRSAEQIAASLHMDVEHVQQVIDRATGG